MEEQDQPSVSVKDLLARMGKEESDVVLGGRSRRHRGGTNGVTVGDLTGEIPVVREGSPRTHRAEQPVRKEQPNRKWSGWPKREDPDAHLADRDREWDFRVLSGEIERVQDRDEPNEQAEELEGGPSIYPEEPQAAPRPEERAGESRWEPLAQEANEERSAFETQHVHSEHDEASAPEFAGEEAAVAGWGESHAQPEPAGLESEEAERRDWFAEPEAAVSGLAEEATPSPRAAEQGETAHDEHTNGAKPHKRISAFKADQLERAREVLTKRKSHGEPVHRTGLGGFVDKIAAVQLPAWASVALQFVTGFFIGAVLFWVFRQVWDAFPLAFAIVLAVLVIVALVLGVRWLRRKNDWPSMAVAGVVGLLVCFGPLTLSLFGR